MTTTHTVTIPSFNITKQYMNNSNIYHLLSLIIPKLKFEYNTLNELRIDNYCITFVSENDSIFYTLSSWDFNILNAVYTIAMHNYTMLRPEWIFQVLSGNTSARITKKKLTSITQSINKLRNIYIEIAPRNSQTIHKRKSIQTQCTFRKSALLPLSTPHEVRAINGKSLLVYDILEKSALFELAEDLHQIIGIPNQYFQTQKLFHDTTESIMIKRYVLNRVFQIVRKNSLISNKISFSWTSSKSIQNRGLFAELGYTPDNYKDWNRKKYQINKIVKKTLDFCKEKAIITSYEPYREHDSSNPVIPISGYRIIYART